MHQARSISPRMMGNPMSYVPDYRSHVLFHRSDRIELDGIPWSCTELDSIHSTQTMTQRPMEYPNLVTKRNVTPKTRVVDPEQRRMVDPFQETFVKTDDE